MVHTGVNCLELLLLVVVRLFVRDMPSVFFVGRFGWTSLLNLFGLWSAEDTEGCEESWALWVSMRVLSLRSASPLELSCILTVHASLCCISLCMSHCANLTVHTSLALCCISLCCISLCCISLCTSHCAVFHCACLRWERTDQRQRCIMTRIQLITFM